jgi:acyl-homoserine lactone acylase PvdQ
MSQPAPLMAGWVTLALATGPRFGLSCAADVRRDARKENVMKSQIRKSLFVGIVILCLGGASRSQSSGEGFITLNVDGDQVRIYRDEYGVPHIFAETSRGLYEAYGYVVAEDRLWQLELNRRAGRGRLAEILGAGSVMADRTVRTLGYTDAELDEQFAQLPAADQERFESYVRGINRYVDEVIVPDPLNKLPFEFHHLGIGVPDPWTAMDAFAFGVREMRGFLERGDGERATQALLNNLVVLHGLSAGLGVFNDVQWTNDPEGSATVPQFGAIGKSSTMSPHRISLPRSERMRSQPPMKRRRARFRRVSAYL